MKSPFAWPGGKRCLLKTLRERIPAHKIYVEVFSGSAKLLFAKDPSPCEVINDLNGDLINFFRVAKHRAAELAELVEHELIHPERFRELADAVLPDELQRAFRFIYLTWYSYGAKGEHFAATNLKEALRGSSRRALDTVRDVLDATAARLSRVRLEQRDFANLIQRFDSPDTFFYLDPPYVSYQPNGRYDPLTAERREELFSLLNGASGNFLMSFDNCEEVRELAARHGMGIEVVETRYGLGSTAASRGLLTEVLISSS